MSSGTTIGLTLGTSPGEETEGMVPQPAEAAAAAAAAETPAPEPTVKVTEEDRKKAEEVKNEGEPEKFC